ncbi:hypothetical protein GCM10009616_17680 [Microlunatus lacustris]
MTASSTTRIALSRSDAVLLTGGGLAVGAALGWFLPPLLGWLTSWPWVPMQGPVTLLSQLVEGVPGWLLPVLGGLLGLLAGLGLVATTTTITVSDREIVVTEGSKRSRWARAQVGAAVVEHGHLSLRDDRDVDLTRESVDGDVPALVDALRRHG